MLTSPTTTALAPSRAATCRATPGVSGAAGSRCILMSASDTAPAETSVTTWVCARSIRNASVRDCPRPTSAVRLSKSATIRRSFSASRPVASNVRSEEHTSELQSRLHLVCRLLLEKKKKQIKHLLYDDNA